MLSAGPKPLPRSPAGLLSTHISDEPISRSPSAISTTSVSSVTNGGLLRRRSTDMSGGLDYYWSSHAGAGPASSSSSLALAISPSPSNFALAATASSPVTTGLKSRSTSNLREKSMEMSAPIPVPKSAEPASYFGQLTSDPSSSSAHSPNVNSAIPSSSIRVGSPGSWSGDSDYSSEDQTQNGGASDRGSSSSSPVKFHDALPDLAKGRRPSELSSDDGGRRNRWVRESVTSATSQMTQTTYRPDEDGSEEKTPVPPPYIDRSDPRAPPPHHLDVTPRLNYPTRVLGPAAQNTPVRPVASPSASGYTPTSGRTPFISPETTKPSPVYGMGVTIPSPQSAPAWKSEFGEIGVSQEEDEETLKSRGKRTTLPATATTSSVSVEALTEPEITMLSPQQVNRVRERTPERRSGEASPVRSPEPPPRSSLRASFGGMEGTSPLSYSPRGSTSRDLPTINYTPFSHDERLTSLGSDRPLKSSPLSGSSSSATINDLTDMLGGAIDAIGLIDSRDTPPPQAVELRKERPSFSTVPPAPVADVPVNRPITPSSLPSRGPSLSLPSAMPMPPPPVPAETTRKLSSGISLPPAQPVPTPILVSPTILTGISQRPWPAAMLFSNIKGMKYTGDRAKAYARNINDLSRAETGLREWCAASASLSRAPPTKSSAMASLGVRSRTSSQTAASSLAVPGPPVHTRNVSASSEFPMRADSYAAREISQRVVDPSDAPSSLPPNLPYPQLQAQFANGSLGGMRSSPSMQSVSSHTSKRSFFSGIGKKSSSSKRDTSSLGPPSGGMSNKKDVRGMPISSPSYHSGPPPKSVSPHHIESRPSISAPMGPRGPRIGTFTPPPAGVERSSTDVPARASLDTGLSRMSSMSKPRSSLDGMGRKGSLPPRQASAMGATGSYGMFGSYAGMGGGPSGEEVNAMANILPHVSKGVVRAYLARYGDQMQAIGMYLEDEKRGTVMRA